MKSKIEVNEMFFYPFGESAWELTAKTAGAIAGSAISIAYVLPKGRREAALRFATGLVAGLVFGSATGVKMAEYLGLDGKLSNAETALTGATLASLCAWSALGFLTRYSERVSKSKN
jgi:hypothetical protein